MGSDLSAPQIFVRMVGLLQLDDHSAWSFLKAVQRSQCPVPREALVRRCASDKALMGLVLAAVEDVSAHTERASTSFPFRSPRSDHLPDVGDAHVHRRRSMACCRGIGSWCRSTAPCCSKCWT